MTVGGVGADEVEGAVVVVEVAVRGQAVGWTAAVRVHQLQVYVLLHLWVELTEVFNEAVGLAVVWIRGGVLACR